MDDADWAAHYATLLEDVKARVRSAQVRAASSANRELVLLYWSIGRDILARQASLGWGAKVIDRLAADLGRTFPTVKGFSPRNLKYMRAFAEAWPDEDFVQQAAARLPWFHNVAIVERVKDPEIRRFFLEGCIAHGWSRNLLAVQIDTRLHERQGRAATNFATTLPAPHPDLAQQLTKDPYVFDFLTLGPEARERDLERGLLHHLRDFLVELGVRWPRERRHRAARRSARARRWGPHGVGRAPRRRKHARDARVRGLGERDGDRGGARGRRGVTGGGGRSRGGRLDLPALRLRVAPVVRHGPPAGRGSRTPRHPLVRRVVIDRSEDDASVIRSPGPSAPPRPRRP